MFTVNNWFVRFLEDYVYAMREPPPRKRTKPMEVLCVGMPRSGTESLQHALLTLGYDHTFHGWDIIYEEPNYCQQWVKLCRKKWFGPLDGNTTFTAEDFDPLIGHSVAVTDAAGSVFAAELIGAYPEAKVILNHRKDLDAWHHSATTTLMRSNGHWPLFILSCLNRECFWAWHVFVRFMWPGLFRALDGNIETGMARNGKWVYREHCNMIRGLVGRERLLEWTVEDGWEPLCEFLGKPVPNEPFPHVNAAAGWAGQEMRLAKKYIRWIRYCPGGLTLGGHNYTASGSLASGAGDMAAIAIINPNNPNNPKVDLFLRYVLEVPCTPYDGARCILV